MMRIRLTLQHKLGAALPIDYAYFISSWIYKTLGKSNNEFATWLHQNGYDFGAKKYKLFTFSRLEPKWFDIDKKQQLIRLSKTPTILEISFFLDDAIHHLVTGLFQDQIFSIGDADHNVNFQVESIEILNRPKFENTMRFKTMTPIYISKKDDAFSDGKFLSPIDESYSKILIENLIRKQRALVKSNDPVSASDIYFEFKLFTAPRSKMYKLKENQKRGFEYEFEITAPKELIELGYYAGFGGQNSALGMGMVKILKL